MTEKMTGERYAYLSKNMDASLTEEEYKAGWHFCYDWDGMLIHESYPEFKCCSCKDEPEECQ
jgi:hypothetical protein